MNPDILYREVPIASILPPVMFASVMIDLSLLNEEQKKAVSVREGPVLVLAGAGSGKTRVVTSRIVRLIETGVPASQILGVTFTNKAAEEMRERVLNVCSHPVLICTFHSLGARVLRESISSLGYSSGFTIYDQDDAEKVVKLCLSESGLKERKLDAKALHRMISKAKNALIEPGGSIESDDAESEEFFPEIYALYQKKLFDYQAVDFDDLLYLTVKLWKEHPNILEHYQERWPFVLIDEYQDTNASQYTMAKLLVEKSGNLFVVGDPDQSIYSWRGADIGNILNFESDYPGARVIRLEQNYRSRTNILNAANALIARNRGRIDKELWSDLGPGEKLKLFTGENERDEARFTASQIERHRLHDGLSLNDMVVFYRTNAQSRAFEDALIYKNIPYTIVGGISFYQRREIKDILAFLRIARSGADYVSFARTINLPKRGIGEATIEKIHSNASSEGMTVIEYCEALLADRPMQTVLRLGGKQRSGLQDYLQIIRDLNRLSAEGSVRDLVIAAAEKTRYVDFLAEEKETFEDRKENLDELIAKAIEWEISAPDPSLEAFLEELSLKSSLDETDSSREKLSLMTIHNGKGLEFTATFLVGLEEDLFPHANSRNNPEAVEEERRLCYVGITRAKEYLYLSHCRMRYLWGTLRAQRPSRFLGELPSEYVEKFKAPGSYSKPSINPVQKRHPERFLDEYSESDESSDTFDRGAYVRHPIFGKGEIKEAYQGSMGLTYKIYFEADRSLKTIVARYAVLNLI